MYVYPVCGTCDPNVRARDRHHATQAKALMRLKFEGVARHAVPSLARSHGTPAPSPGLEREKELTDRASVYFKKPQEYAMDRYAYYKCCKCKARQRGGGY